MANFDAAQPNEIEMLCFQLVAQVGSARSSFVEAINRAENGDFAGAEACFAEGDNTFSAGHALHAEMLKREGEGEQLPFRIIILHAEDLMMSAETLRIIAEKFVNVYKNMEG